MSGAAAHEIPYPADTIGLFERVAHLPWAVLLDSCHPHYPEARYDIVAAGALWHLDHARSDHPLALGEARRGDPGRSLRCAQDSSEGPGRSPQPISRSRAALSGISPTIWGDGSSACRRLQRMI